MTDSAFDQNASKDRDKNLTTYIVLHNVLILFYLVIFETANIEQNFQEIVFHCFQMNRICKNLKTNKNC